MPLTTIRTAPTLDSFTSLADHQSQTPASFFSAPPVLHYHGTGVRALAHVDLAPKLPIFPSDGHKVDSEHALPLQEMVDVFVSSENLTLFNPATSTGVSIPYPAISIHAVQRIMDQFHHGEEVSSLYMLLELSDLDDMAEEEDAQIELTLILQLPTSDAKTSSIQTLFEAVSNCSNLHPDPAFGNDADMDDGEADSRIIFEGSVGYEGITGLPGVQRGAVDGSLPPPFPGSGGWITAENVSEYFDTDGNWIGEEPKNLGQGAGRVRVRDEVDGDENGDAIHKLGEPDSDVNKRARTD